MWIPKYWSAIITVHKKVDGYVVGQHPPVSQLIKGAFHEQPPQTRYSKTWDVAKVIHYTQSLGSNTNLSMNDITFKTLMLMTLTQPLRSISQTNLILDHHLYSPEGVTFKATKLAKQSRLSKQVA